jgi:hypothetical protein
MHNCNPEGKKHILKSWAVRAGAWTVWELVIAGNWLGYRYLGASWFMNIFEVMQFCVQSRHTSSQKEFSMHKVNKCSIVVSFEGVCVLCSLHLDFVFSCLKQLKCKLGLQPKKILTTTTTQCSKYQGRKIYTHQAHAIPSRPAIYIYIYYVTSARSCSPEKEMSNKWWTCS